MSTNTIRTDFHQLSEKEGDLNMGNQTKTQLSEREGKGFESLSLLSSNTLESQGPVPSAQGKQQNQNSFRTEPHPRGIPVTLHSGTGDRAEGVPVGTAGAVPSAEMLTAELPAVHHSPQVGEWVDVLMPSGTWLERCRVEERLVRKGLTLVAIKADADGRSAMALDVPGSRMGFEWRYSKCGECGARAPGCCACGETCDACHRPVPKLGELVQVLVNGQWSQPLAVHESPDFSMCVRLGTGALAVLDIPSAKTYGGRVALSPWRYPQGQKEELPCSVDGLEDFLKTIPATDPRRSALVTAGWALCDEVHDWWDRHAPATSQLEQAWVNFDVTARRYFNAIMTGGIASVLAAGMVGLGAEMRASVDPRFKELWQALGRFMAAIVTAHAPKGAN